MARSSILGGDHAATHAAGTDADALGPSDSSDSGSDVQGELDFAEGRSDSDASGTGERGSAVDGENVQEGRDISPDHIEAIGADAEAGENDEPARSVRQRVEDVEADEAYDTDEDDEG